MSLISRVQNGVSHTWLNISFPLCYSFVTERHTTLNWKLTFYIKKLFHPNKYANLTRGKTISSTLNFPLSWAQWFYIKEVDDLDCLWDFYRGKLKVWNRIWKSQRTHRLSPHLLCAFIINDCFRLCGPLLSEKEAIKNVFIFPPIHV